MTWGFVGLRINGGFTSVRTPSLLRQLDNVIGDSLGQRDLEALPPAKVIERLQQQSPPGCLARQRKTECTDNAATHAQTVR